MSQCFVSVYMMVCVSYYIVMERKGLGMVQRRHGPNKVGFKGVFQPVADGVKLFTKEIIFPAGSSKSLFFMGPFLCFFCAYSLWILYPSCNSNVEYEFGLLYFMCISSFSVYGILLVGWACDSRYAFLGAMRAIAQTISYEVLLSGLLFCSVIMMKSFDLLELREDSYLAILFSLDMMSLWMLAILAETHRAPFDFVEGESELVSGYNVEFGGTMFALLALAEYSNMLFMSMLSTCLFFGWFTPMVWFGDFFFSFIMFSFGYLIILIRGTMPRYRYDLLMMECWKDCLPQTLLLFASLVSIEMLFDYFIINSVN